MIEYDTTVELVQTDVAHLLTQSLCKGALEGMRVQEMHETEPNIFTLKLTKVEEIPA